MRPELPDWRFADKAVTGDDKLWMLWTIMAREDVPARRVGARMP